METADRDLSRMSVPSLLRLYSELLSELVQRGVVRSRNAPAGDFGEYLVAAAYAGTLAPAGAKSWDVLARDGRRLQVKTRLVDPKIRRTAYFSPFRSFDFDACVFVLLDGSTYSVHSGIEVPAHAVKEASREVAWVAGWRIAVGVPLLTLPGAQDVTGQLSKAFGKLEKHTSTE